MPDAPGLNIAQQLGQVLQAQGTTPRRIREILTQAVREVGDQFITDGTLTQAVRGLDPRLQQLITQTARRLFPPTPFPRGIRPDDVNNGRIFHGGAAPDQTDHNWAWAMVGLRGANFNIGDYNPLGVVTNTLAQEGALGAPATNQGAAVARGLWRDNFFSSIEFASTFQYMQTLPPAQREEFQRGFLNQSVNEINRVSNGNVQQQRYMTRQFIRLAANTNWDNQNTPPEFREFTRNFGDALVNGLPAYRNLRDQVQGDGRTRVAQTYDLDGERHTYGGAFMSLYRDQNGQVRTGVFRHIPSPAANLWNFNFPPVPGVRPQPGGAQPGFPAQPGWGNFPAWPAQPQLPPGAPGPLFPPPGGAGIWPPAPAPGGFPPGGVGPVWPPAAGAAPVPPAGGRLPAQRLPNMNPAGGRFAQLNGANFSYRVGNDPSAPLVNPGQANNGITINPDGTYTVNAGVPNGTRVTIVLPNGQNLTTTVESGIGNENSIRPGATQRNPELNGTPFRVKINDGQLLQPDQNNPVGQGIVVRPNGDIVVPPGTPIGTRITIVTDSGQTVTRVVEPDINTTGLASGAANLDDRLEVPSALNLKVKLAGSTDAPITLNNDWQDIGDGIKVRRGPNGEVQFSRTPGAPAGVPVPLEFTTEGGQSTIVQLDTTPPVISDQTVGNTASTGRLTLPSGVRVTGIRMEQGTGGIINPPDANFIEVHPGNTELNQHVHPSGFTVSNDGHFNASGLGTDNARFIIRTSDGREFRVTTNVPGGIPL